MSRELTRHDKNGSKPDRGWDPFTNSIGDALLMGYWTDPDFDPAERAFYYVRALGIPTPNWTTYDAAFFGVDLPEDIPASQQERAYTSPIWYTLSLEGERALQGKKRTQ